MTFKRRQTGQRKKRAGVPVFVPLECHSEALVPRVVKEPVPRLWAHTQQEEGKECVAEGGGRGKQRKRLAWTGD